MSTRHFSSFLLGGNTAHRLLLCSTTQYGDTAIAAAVAAPRWLGYGAAVLRGDVVHLLWPRAGAISEHPADGLAGEVPVGGAALLLAGHAVVAFGVFFLVCGEEARKRENSSLARLAKKSADVPYWRVAAGSLRLQHVDQNWRARSSGVFPTSHISRAPSSYVSPLRLSAEFQTERLSIIVMANHFRAMYTGVGSKKCASSTQPIYTRQTWVMMTRRRGGDQRPPCSGKPQDAVDAGDSHRAVPELEREVCCAQHSVCFDYVHGVKEAQQRTRGS